MTSKIPLFQIIIVREEGPSHLCDKVQIAWTFDEAEYILRKNAMECSAQGYFKHKILIWWADGTDFSYRADVVNPQSGMQAALHPAQMLAYLLARDDGKATKGFDFILPNLQIAD